MIDKPHLVLDWVLDVPNQILSCEIDENLVYVAIKGGTGGFIKKFRVKSTDKFTETEVTPDEWDAKEKFWISDNYGEKVGYFQPDYNRVVTHPKVGREDNCPMGIGPDGRYLDHMQRIQSMLEGEDAVLVYETDKHVTFESPDGGKTILKLIPIYPEDTNYIDIPEEQKFWKAHPQPCAMQPTSPGRLLSSYDEMIELGVPKAIVDKCKAGEWELPEHPEYFTKYYKY